MRFDWPRFLRQRGIEFVPQGKREIVVRCPLCGPADPSQHLCINLDGKGWHCWRSESHRGRSRARLIQLLLDCSRETAHELAGGDVRELVADGDLAATLRTRLLGTDAPRRSTVLAFPKEFKPLTSGVLARPFHEYLKGRGYRERQIAWLSETYGLHYATRGPFGYRIVIPVRDERRKLLTWTARSIREGEALRYKALGATEALTSIRDTLLGLDLLARCPQPKALLVCEGPFDAFWITLYGQPFGVYGTCLFGLVMSDAQAALLVRLRQRFRHIGLLLDSAASFQAFRLAQSGLDLDIIRLPSTVKDPALLSADAAIELCLTASVKNSMWS